MHRNLLTAIPHGAKDGAHKGRHHLARPGEAGELVCGREAFQVRHVDGGTLKIVQQWHVRSLRGKFVSSLDMHQHNSSSGIFLAT